MKIRYLIIFAFLALCFAAVRLSANAQEVKAQKAAIVQSDAAGEDTTTALNELEAFSHSHMNAGVTLTLEGAYARALAAAQPKATAGVYAAAQAACASQKNSMAQVKCNSDYIAAHSTPGSATVAEPSKASFAKTFSSPRWTPDLAGISLLAAAASLALAAWLVFMRLI